MHCRHGRSCKHMYLIEDQSHSEWQEPRFQSFDQAMAELRRRANIPWNEEPNVAPCQNWQKCGREYAIIEFDWATKRELSRVVVLEISAEGVRWVNNE